MNSSITSSDLPESYAAIWSVSLEISVLSSSSRKTENLAGRRLSAAAATQKIARPMPVKPGHDDPEIRRRTTDRRRIREQDS